MINSTDILNAAELARENTVPMSRIRVITPLSDHAETDGVDLELYHFAFSICSMKVRAVLEETGSNWRSLELEPGRHENYKQDYVSLRLLSERGRTSSAAKNWTGSSSVDDAGFDALVVPTLFDAASASVIADSLRICLYLSKRSGASIDLVPQGLEDDILKELRIVDKTPHLALLYGANPSGDKRPEMFRKGLSGEHERKIEAVQNAYDRLVDPSPKLKVAYEAKIAKEKAGLEFVSSPENMKSAVAQLDDLVDQLADRLRRSGGAWFFGEQYTLADLFWGVSLFRIEYLGYGWVYRDVDERLPVADYADKVCQRKSIINSVSRWPNHPNSSFVEKWLRGAPRQ